MSLSEPFSGSTGPSRLFRRKMTGLGSCEVSRHFCLSTANVVSLESIMTAAGSSCIRNVMDMLLGIFLSENEEEGDEEVREESCSLALSCITKMRRKEIKGVREESCSFAIW